MLRQFSEALTRGHEAERAWVDEQRSHGLAVAHGIRVVADKFNPNREHMQHPDAAAVFRIEIKERNLTFTCPEDYPYPTAFLCNLSIVAKDITPPLIYVLKSQATGHWVWVAATDKTDAWLARYHTDTTRGTKVLMLECPKEDLRPAQELRELIMHLEVLDLVDGGSDAFRTAGASGDRCDPAEADRRTDRRKRPPKGTAGGGVG